MGLPVSKKHGVNPAIAVCEQCGKDTGELLLLGRCNEYECQDCGAKTYGRLGLKMKCPKCDSLRMIKTRTDVAAPMHLRSQGICEECRKMNEEHAALVRQGGVYWRCQACGSSGVIRPGAGLALAVRHTSGIVAPKPVGVDFTAEQCPVCRAQKEKTDD